jgi:hypothetical protein
MQSCSKSVGDLVNTVRNVYGWKIVFMVQLVILLQMQWLPQPLRLINYLMLRLIRVIYVFMLRLWLLSHSFTVIAIVSNEIIYLLFYRHSRITMVTHLL